MGASKELFMQEREAEMNQEISPVISEKYSKQSQIEIAERMLFNVDEGHANPLTIFIKLRNLQAAVEMAIDLVKPLALEEGQKLSKTGEKISGVQVSVVGGKRSCDYSNDREWTGLKEKIKDREEFLKGLQKPMADIETGEIINPPIIKYSQDTVNLKFA